MWNRPKRRFTNRQGGRNAATRPPRRWRNVVNHEHKIERGGDKVAEVSKRCFRIRDYGIEIAPGEDGALILAVTVCIVQMTRD